MDNNQKKLWDNIHTKGKQKKYSNAPNDFAIEVEHFFPPHAKIAELGCGLGTDSAFFAQQGHIVCGTDFSKIAITQNTQQYKDIPNLVFQFVDLNQSLPFQDDELDGIYARLSLHYFHNAITKRIFKEIYRVLKPDGILAFICKSTEDPLYGKGKRIEKDMFDQNGHIRHFFSEDYTKSCLKKDYHIQKLQRGKENFYGKPSAYIKIIAKKTKLL